MVRPDAIQHYMNITGASESLAIQSLEEHDNNLAEAISSHFRDVERSILGSDFDTRSEYNVVEDNYPRPEYNQVHGNESRPVPGGGLPSLLEAPFAHLQSIFPSLRPSLLLDPNYRRNLHHDLRRQLSGGLGSGNSGNPSPSSHTGGEVTGFPAPHSSTTWRNDQIPPPPPPGYGDFRDGYAPHSSSTWRNDQIPPPPPRFGEVRDGYPPHSSSTWRNDQIHPPPPGFGEVRDGYARPSPSYGSQVHSNDAEEEMIRAAIEASKKDFEDRRYYDPASVLSRNEVINREDEEMARAISMSLELEEQESAFREQLAEFMPQSMEHRDPFQSNINESSRYKPRSSSVQDKREGTKQKQPIGSSSQHGHGNQNVEASYHEELLRTIKKEPLPIKPRSMEHRDPFQSNINESSRYKPTSSSVQYKRKDMKQKQPIDSSSQHRHGNQNVEASYPEKWGGNPRSSSVQYKRKDMKQKQPIDSSSQHRHGNQNVEASYPEKWGGIPSKELAIKREMLPFEPSIEDGDAISLLVKMPDGSRHGRCFLKFYKLKHLFDFIDATGLVKPGTYRLVRSYPRRDFSLQEGALSFVELGLTNKHEVLFLELLV